MSRKSISTTAASRLRQDYLRVKKDPVPYITAEPLPSNILEWHYVITGPEKSPYEGGYYHGKLVFPREFPFKPPKIIMITPSGRFKTNTRLCLSISDFHPDTWNPAWSVSTILTGLLSFMLEKSPTLGSIETSDFQKRQYAMRSLDFNIKDKTFCDLFPDISQTLKTMQEKQYLGYPLYEVTSSSLTHSCSSSLLPYGICDWTLKLYGIVFGFIQTFHFYQITGYPFYEFTSSGLTHTCSLPPPNKLCRWFIKNVVASCFRVSSVITEINFGIIRINWETEPVKISFELHGEGGILTSTTVSINDLETRRTPAVCPPAIEQPNWYWKRVFWFSVIILAISFGILVIWLSIITCRWFIRAVLKDLDVKIKNGFVKLSKKNKVKHE